MKSLAFLILQSAGFVAGCTLLWQMAVRKVPSPIGMTFTFVLCLAVALPLFYAVQPGRVFDDFIPVYWEAGNAVLTGPDELLPLLSIGVLGGFVNLPIVAYLFAPFALIPSYPAAWLFLVLGVTAVGLAWWKASELYHLSNAERAVGLLLICSFGPLFYGLKEGNLTHFLLLPLVYAISLFRNRRDFRAGMLLGLAGLLKPPLILLCVFALLRLRIAAVAGAASVILIATIASIAIFGIDSHRIWFESNLLTFSRDPLAAANAHSLASVVARFEYPDMLMVWESVRLSPEANLILVGGIAVLVIFGFWATAPWKRLRVGVFEFEAEFMLAITFLLLASTLSWTHYFAYMLLPFLWLSYYFKKAGANAVAYVLWAAGILLSIPGYVRWSPPPGSEPYLPFVFAHLFVGTAIIYGLLIWARHRTSADISAGASPITGKFEPK